MELPAPVGHPEVESFFEDYTADESVARRRFSNQEGHRQASKATNAYPTPPPTPPPAALLVAGVMSEDQPQVNSHGSSKTVPWSAAFMAGTQAGNVGQHQGEVIDKAKLKRLLVTGKKPQEIFCPRQDASSQSAPTSPNV
ncbi:hypothetical protein E4U60_007429 [Claviceps pazoutovae]|uniref:Uncharacterized protein n=1 Tax=Claviceps pazoutovae TaxID=1649127 RepID=A0A9P7SD98_9HYPO|nr:hypothetical protein E4U61_001706 [Claviceps capensis]KAG5929444.1 hypothetical protein E4U60_007429 [Claviceps pazoutovae]